MSVLVSPAFDHLSPAQRDVRQLVREIARDTVAARAAEIDESDAFPWDIVDVYRETGRFGLLFVEDCGGVGESALLTLVAIEELAKASLTCAGILSVQDLGALAIKLAGSREQKQAFLPPLASGERLAAYALTEAEAGSDSAAMLTQARRVGDGYVLSGTKRFITNAGVAHLYVCFAKTDASRGTKGVTAFVVDADSPGCVVGRVEAKMGLKGSPTGELVLADCVVPAANRLGAEGDGFRIAMQVLDRSRPAVAAQALGLAQGATDYAVDYARTRQTMGKPIGKHQLIAAMLADMETGCEVSRAFLYKVGQMIDEGLSGPLLTKYSAMCKLHCTDVAMRVTTDAVQVLGGYGYVREHPVERMMRDAKITQIYEGTNQIQRLVIGRELLRETGRTLAASISPV